jgi:pimeloyl-ACP methyl ester carboxylesterase
MSGKPTIVLIHGLWMTPSCWNDWASRFRAAGHEVIAPGWPGVGDRSAADIRRDPSGIKGVGLRQVVDHYQGIIETLAQEPIIMGHSFGGLIAQMLADRGHGAAIAGVAPAQPAGIRTLPFSMLWTGLPVLANPFRRNGATPISRSHFHYAFCGDLSRAESDRIWDEEVIPSYNRVLLQGAAAAFNQKRGASHVDFERSNRAPILLIAGEKDRAVPPAVVKATLSRYSRKGSTSIVEYREFAGRTHRLVSQDGWEEVADAALEWAVAHSR